MFLSVQLQLESEKHKTAKVEFVMVTNNLHSYKILSQISETISSLGSKVDFEPVYYLKQVDEEEYQRVNQTHFDNDFTQKADFEEHCFYGRYCMHHDRESKYSLKEFFEETERQLCLFKIADRPEQWWAYVQKYRLACLERPEYKTLGQCYHKVMESAGIQSLKDRVRQCVSQNNGGGDLSKKKDRPSKNYIIIYEKRNIKF